MRAFVAAAVVLALSLPPRGSVTGAGGSPGPAAARATLYFYWGHDCSRCDDAKPFVRALEAEYPGLDVRWMEVRHDAEGRRRFVEHVRALGMQAVGVPTFILGAEGIVGFRAGVTEAHIRRMVESALAVDATTGTDAARVELPILGPVDPAAVPFPAFTVAIGLLDGLNPCAMWVLMVMLGVLVHARSRRRLALVGGTFVLMSGVVYFLFMTVWAGIFALGGVSRELTRALGAVLVVMGLVNLKEIAWFGRGVSLVIPARAKPGLFRRVRAVAGAASVPAALLGVAALAFVVNLIELACTIGLPAVYTRILSLRPEISWAARYAYLALYCVAYVVPLGLVVAAYALTLHRMTLTERGAKALKAVSGLLLVSFGAVFALRPELLG